MLRQHHEESFVTVEPCGRLKAEANEELVSLVWVAVTHGDPAAIAAYIAAAVLLNRKVEFVLVNNGCGDSALDSAIELIQEADIPVTMVQLHSRCPDSVALSTACRAAHGQFIVTLPSYLQVVPTALTDMVGRLGTGLDFVASVRVSRVDGKSEQAKSYWFNRAVRWISGIHLHDLNSGLKAFNREVIEGVPVYGDLHIYLPILAAKQGFRVGEVEVGHLEERDGTSGPSMYVRRALDLLTIFFLVRFTQRPFRFFGSIGTGMIGAGFAINFVMVVQRLVFDKSMADRPMLVLGALLMALGVQVFSLGLLGELIIFAQAGGLKPHRVHEVLTDRSIT